MVYLHKVDVKHHSHQGDENSTRQNSCVLREEKHRVGDEPHRAGVHHHLTDGHFRRANSELSAKTGVILTGQRYGFAIDVSEGFIFHRKRKKPKQG